VQLALDLIQDAVNSMRGAIFTELPRNIQGAKMQELANLEEGLKREIRGSTTVRDLLMAEKSDLNETELVKFEKMYDKLMRHMSEARNKLLSISAGY